MKTLIAFCSTHGCTETTANELKEYLQSNVELCNLKKDQMPSIENFDRVVVGGSIHAGQIQKRVKDFCIKNEAVLLQKELGLFICCMEEGETAAKQINEAFSEKLHQNAKAEAYFGGEFNFNKMNFF